MLAKSEIYFYKLSAKAERTRRFCHKNNSWLIKMTQQFSTFNGEAEAGSHWKLQFLSADDKWEVLEEKALE